MKTDPFYPFDPVSEKEWKQKIQADLKGADYNETLVWQSEEGIDVKPFYSVGSAQYAVGSTQYAVGSTQYAVGSTKGVSWRIGIRLDKDMESIPEDVESVVIPIADENQLPEAIIKTALDQGCFIHYEMDFLSQEAVSRLQEHMGDSPDYALNVDILGHLARSGNWHHSNQEDHAILQFLLQHAQAPFVCSVDTGLFQNAGANRVQQLAYGLAQANEYLNFGAQHQLVLKPLVYKTSLDGNFFFEIAKLRALRWLWKSLAAEYGMEQDCHILAVPSLRNKSTYDYNTNLLRSTMECTAAILGGADTVVNQAYDAHFKPAHEFSRRIALNQLRVLKHEAYLDQVLNPADGAYYIEHLTQQLAHKALQLFKEIEAAGGYYRQLREGTIQRKIREQAAKQQAAFDACKDKYVGANAYQNQNESVLNELEIDPFLEKKPRKTEIEPIVVKRLAEQLEKRRMGDE